MEILKFLKILKILLKLIAKVKEKYALKGKMGVVLREIGKYLLILTF